MQILKPLLLPLLPLLPSLPPKLHPSNPMTLCMSSLGKGRNKGIVGWAKRNTMRYWFCSKKEEKEDIGL